MEHKHNERCENAKSPICECSCGGALHGIKREELDKAIGEKYMALSEGGELEAFMRAHIGKTMKCLGACDRKIVIEEFRGYPHTEGLADKDGKRWWIYVHCDKCNYDTSWGKIDGRIRAASNETTLYGYSNPTPKLVNVPECPKCHSNNVCSCPGGTCLTPTKNINWMCEECLNEW